LIGLEGAKFLRSAMSTRFVYWISIEDLQNPRGELLCHFQPFTNSWIGLLLIYLAFFFFAFLFFF